MVYTVAHSNCNMFYVIVNFCITFYSYMSNNYTIYEVEEPSKLFLRPDSVIDNVDGFIRGLMETSGREAQPSYNDLVTIYSNALFVYRAYLELEAVIILKCQL